MNLPINDGERPSRLELDRYHTGEHSAEEAADLEARLGDREHAHLAALEAARAQVQPFDAAALRRRAATAPPPATAPAPATPSPANRPLWMLLAPLALAAAVLLAMMAAPSDVREPGAVVVEPDAPDIRFRGGGVQLFVADRGRLQPWSGEPLAEGDVVGFQVDAGRAHSVVLLSVDGEGSVSVLWPEGDAMVEPLRGDGQVPLPGTLTLDDAPGPETFLAIYDTPAPDAAMRAEHIHRREGSEGLLRWADTEDVVDAVQVERASPSGGTLER